MDAASRRGAEPRGCRGALWLLARDGQAADRERARKAAPAARGEGAVTDLDHRLARGPLRVRNVWSGATLEGVTRRGDRRRRVSFVLDLMAACACVAELPIVP